MTISVKTLHLYNRNALSIPESGTHQWRTEGGFKGGFNPHPTRNTEVLKKLSRIPSSVEKYIRNNRIRIRVSLICKLSGTPD
jgi:hypothetical protein